MQQRPPSVPSPLRAGKSPSREHRLEAVLVWAPDHRLETRELAPGDVLHVGPGAGASVQVFHDALPRDAPLARALEGDAFEVFLPAGVDARVRLGGEELDGAELLARGLATPVDVPFHGARCELGAGDSATFTFGPVLLALRRSTPARMARRPLRDRVDADFLTKLAILLLAGVFLDRMIALTDWTDVKLGEELVKRPDVIVRTEVKHADPPKLQRLPAPRTMPAPDREGLVGRRDATRRQAARSRERLQQEMGTIGLVGMLRRMGTDARSVFGGVGGGWNETLGGLGGPNGGDLAGLDGLGSRGDGPGGGGDRTVGIGNPFGPRGHPHGTGLELGAGRKLPTVIVKPEAPTAIGVDRELIARVVRRHYGEIRYCYEKHLQAAPHLYGKVAVSFEIGPFGDVTAASIRESTMEHEGVEGCIVEKVKHWRFALPAGSPIVQVTYPFVLTTK